MYLNINTLRNISNMVFFYKTAYIAKTTEIFILTLASAVDCQLRHNLRQNGLLFGEEKKILPNWRNDILVIINIDVISSTGQYMTTLFTARFC